MPKRCATCRGVACGPGLLLTCHGAAGLPDLGDVLVDVFAKTLLAFCAVLAACLLTSCGAHCESAYLRDSARERPYYRVDYCPGKAPRVVCDSTSRLPNGECR